MHFYRAHRRKNLPTKQHVERKTRINGLFAFSRRICRASTIACALVVSLVSAKDAQALGGSSTIRQSLSVGTCVVFTNIIPSSSAANIIVYRGSVSFANFSQYLGGGGYFLSGFESRTQNIATLLESGCAVSDITNIEQGGATGSGFASEAEISHRFRATEGSGDRYDFVFEIRGVTNSTVTASKTLVDGIAPRVSSIERHAPTVELTNADLLTWRVTFDEGVQNVSPADFAVAGTTASISAVTAISASVFDVTASGGDLAGLDATVTISFAAGQDIADASEANALTNTTPTGRNDNTFTLRNVRPTISIAPFTGPANGDQTALITLSEPSTNFGLADLTLTNATAVLTGSGTSYSAVLTPLTDGTVNLSVAAATFTDAVGNDNMASNEVISTVDLTAPTISIAPFTGPANGDQTALITLSEPSTNFGLADLTLTNATAVLTGSGTSYSAVLTPLTDGTVNLSVAAATFTDAVGNDNMASNEVVSTVDLTAPTISIAPFTGPANGDQTALITLSEPSTNFGLADLTLTNATAVLTGSGTSYSAVLTPLTDGTVNLSVAAATFTDASGNANTAASNEVSSTFDGTAPTVVVSTTATKVVGATAFDVEIVFSEPVTGFEVGDVTVINGSATTLNGAGSTYSATITASGAGTTEISIAANMVQDAATNGNLASNTLSIANATVEETQKIIAQFQQTRANQLIANQPNLTVFLSGPGRGTFDAQATPGFGRFDFVSDPDHSVWTRLSSTWSEDGSTNSTYVFGALGSHVAVSPNLLVGAMLQYDHMSQDDGVAKTEGTGWLAGPYFVAKLTDQPLYFDGRILYGETSNTVTPFGTYKDEFNTTRWLAQLGMTGELDYGRTTLMPSLHASYTTDTQAAYADGLGNQIPKQSIELSQLELGLGFSHFPVLTNGQNTLELTGGVFLIETASNSTSSISSAVPTFEGSRARVNLGANYTLASGAILSFNTVYDGTGSSGFESYGAEIGYRMEF